MVLGNEIYEIPKELINKFSGIVNLLQAFGIIIAIYLIISIINMFVNKRRTKEIIKIGKDVEDIKKLLKRKK